MNDGAGDANSAQRHDRVSDSKATAMACLPKVAAISAFVPMF